MMTAQLFQAIEKKDACGVMELINQGVDVNAKDSEGRSALFAAIPMGDITIVLLLIAHGANVNESRSGCTPLMFACSIGNFKIVEILIQEEANLNDIDQFSGYSAIVCATINGNEAIMNLLIKKGADVSIDDNVRRKILAINPFLRIMKEDTPFPQGKVHPFHTIRKLLEMRKPLSEEEEKMLQFRK